MADTVREQRIKKRLNKVEDEQERKKLLKKLETEQARARRVGNVVPPKNKKGESLPLDLATEQAIEFLRENRPMVGRKQLEWASFHRRILQEAAKKRGWNPPGEGESDG